MAGKFVQQTWMERATGIEPMPEAWRAPVLPLNYTRFVYGKTRAQTNCLHHGVTVSTVLWVSPFIVAEIVEVVETATAVLVTVKVADVAPDAMVTVAGTVAAALSLDRVTTAPPAGAAPSKVTVPVEDDPPVTLAGLSDMLDRAAGLIVRVAVCESPKSPVIVTETTAPTALVFTAKLAVVAPAATVTLAATVASALSLDRVTTAPSAGAALLRVTVPVEEDPPVTLAGATETLESTGGLIAKAVVCGPLKLAVMVAEVVVPTAVVLTVKFAVASPAATITLAATVAAALSLDRVTTAPPAGAGPFRVTVPVEEDPPVRLAGLTETEVSTAGLIVRPAVFAAL
jgi:hypothetical protein